MVAGCKGTPTSPLSTGSITGQIVLVDSNCMELPSSAGIAIELIGTGIKTTTDSLGFWTLTNVPAGYYNIKCSKSGFSSYEWTNVEFVGSGILPIYQTHGHFPEILVPRTLTTLKEDSVMLSINYSPYRSYPNDSQITATVSFSVPDTNTSRAGASLTYVSKTPTIDPMNINTYFAVGTSIALSDGTASIAFLKKDNNISSGDTLYFGIAYEPPCSTDPFDKLIGSIPHGFVPSAGPLSNVIQVVVP